MRGIRASWFGLSGPSGVRTCREIAQSFSVGQGFWAENRRIGGGATPPIAASSTLNLKTYLKPKP